MNKVLTLKLNIRQLLLSNVHLVHTKKFLKVSLKPYLCGFRNNVYILNIKQTTVQLKFLINFLINTISLRQKILIVKDRDIFNFDKLLNLSRVYYSDEK
jgi:small subunit ribosomal protein S2